MKYSEKFFDIARIIEERENMIRGVTTRQCVVCGDDTDFIEVNYEAELCSEECVLEMDLRSSTQSCKYREWQYEDRFEENTER